MANADVGTIFACGRGAASGGPALERAVLVLERIYPRGRNSVNPLRIAFFVQDILKLERIHITVSVFVLLQSTYAGFQWRSQGLSWDMPAFFWVLMDTVKMHYSFSHTFTTQ